MLSIGHAASGSRDAIYPAKGSGWTLSDIPFGQIDSSRIHNESTLFYLLAAASFVEITSSLYTRNLVAHFSDVPDAQNWLSDRWLPEEMQHGEALKRYVVEVWPEFHWERAYQNFLDQYARLCTSEALEADRGLEMVARCVVEVGTSTYYRALSERSPEPVLRRLLERIARDEVRHYTYFHAFFRKYAKHRNYSRWEIGRTIVRRIAEINSEDMRIAIAAVRAGLPPSHSLKQLDYRAIRRQGARTIEGAYPFRMAAYMLLRPLSLPPLLNRMLTPLCVHTARLALFRLGSLFEFNRKDTRGELILEPQVQLKGPIL